MNSLDSYEIVASFLQAEYFSAVSDARSNDNVSVLLEIGGSLNTDALAAALNLLSRRHDVLRTALAQRGPIVIQRVTAVEPPPLTLADVPGPDLVRFLTDELQRPFLLTEAPLWRAALVRLDEQRHVLALTLHHSIADRWSGETIRRDLAALYAAARNNRASNLLPLPIQFGDYAHNEHTADLSSSESYWRYTLNPLPPAPRLPDSGEWRPGDPFTVAVRPHPGLSPAATDRLREVCLRCHATFGETVHAAAAAALSPFFDHEMVLGVLYANRKRAELVPLIGALFDHLPIRVQIDKKTNFLQFLTAFHANWAAATANTIPLGRITSQFEHQLSPDRLIFDAEINYMPYADPKPITVHAGPGRVSFGYFRDAVPDSFDIRLAREVTPNGRLGFQVEVVDSGALQGSVFANADALGWPNLRAMGNQLFTAFERLARHPRDPIRSLIQDLVTN